MGARRGEGAAARTTPTPPPSSPPLGLAPVMSRPAQTRTQQGEEDEGLRGPSQRARVTPPPRVAGILTFRLKCHTICSQQREGPISIRAWPNSL
jgi:hypothetical protein